MILALTIHQPYAELIARGAKPIENRTWPTPYRGRLLIHAGKSRDWLGDGDERRYRNMPFGAIVAIATVADCQRLEDLSEDLRNHEHANGPWCWVLRDVARLENPVPTGGFQKLWMPSQELLAAVRQQLPSTASTTVHS